MNRNRYFRWLAVMLAVGCLFSSSPVAQGQAQTKADADAPRLFPSDKLRLEMPKPETPPATLPASTGAGIAELPPADPQSSEVALSEEASVGDRGRQQPLVQGEELTEQRTRTGMAVRNEDGSISRIVSPESMHYRVGDEWKPIDTTLRPDRSSPGYTYSMVENAFQVRVHHEKHQTAVAFQSGTDGVVYRPLQMNPVSGVVNGNQVRYADAWPSTDMRYSIRNDVLKMDLVLKDEQAPATFSFRLQANGVEPKMNADSSIDFIGPNGEKRFRIPRMWVQDMSSTALRYDRLQVQVRKSGADWILDITLNDAGLMYPITIDPSTTLIFNTLYAGGTVYLYDKTNRLMQTVSPKGTVDFQYDKNGNQIRRQPSDNLLANGGFEIYTGTTGSADGWIVYGSGTAPSIVRSSARFSAGDISHKIADGGMPSGYFSGVYQRFKVSPNKAFAVSGQFDIVSLANAKVQLYVDFLNAQHQFIGAHITETTFVTNNRFMTVAGNGTVPANAAYAIVYALLRATGSNGSGEFYVDLMDFRYQTEPNLVANGGFELATLSNGLADGWSQYWNGSAPNHQAVTAPVSAGNRAHRIADSGMPMQIYSGLQQLVKVAPGQPYTGTVRVNVQSITNARMLFYLDFMNASHQYIGSNIVDVGPATNGKYVTASAQGTTPANAAYVVVYLLLFSDAANASATVHVDSVRLKLDAANKVSNSGFEEFPATKTIANDWTSIVTGGTALFARTSTFAYSGSLSQLVSGSGMANGQFAAVYQNVRIGPGTAYTSSGKFMILTLSNAKVQFYIDFYNNQDQIVGSIFAEHNAVTTPQWFNFYANGTTPAGTAYARMYALVRSTGSSGSGSFLVDAISLQ